MIKNFLPQGGIDNMYNLQDIIFEKLLKVLLMMSIS